MPTPLEMQIKDIFYLQNGRTVLVGPVKGGERAIIEAGPADVWVNGSKIATIRLEGPMIPNRSNPLDRQDEIAVSTLDATGLTKELAAGGECRLEGTMRVAGHRHLLGLESPPRRHVPDDLTLGPHLPEGWDGDAWMNPEGGGYWLRAWNKQTGRIAYGSGSTYEEARQNLLNAVKHGKRGVEIVARELVTS